jgi:hypothetical protein
MNDIMGLGCTSLIISIMSTCERTIIRRLQACLRMFAPRGAARRGGGDGRWTLLSELFGFFSWN